MTRDGHNASVGVAGHRVNIKAEWEAFDKLPKFIRDYLNNADGYGADDNYDAIETRDLVFGALQSGTPPAVIEAQLRAYAKAEKEKMETLRYGNPDPEKMIAFRRALEIAARKR